jgi:hypothetical protein
MNKNTIIEVEERAKIIDLEETRIQLSESFWTPDVIDMITFLYPKKENPSKPRIRVSCKNWWPKKVQVTEKVKSSEDSSDAIELNTNIKLHEIKDHASSWVWWRILQSSRFEFHHEWVKYVLSDHKNFWKTLETEIELRKDARKEEVDEAKKTVKIALHQLWYEIMKWEEYDLMRDRFWNQWPLVSDSFIESLNNKDR